MTEIIFAICDAPLQINREARGTVPEVRMEQFPAPIRGENALETRQFRKAPQRFVAGPGLGDDARADVAVNAAEPLLPVEIIVDQLKIGGLLVDGDFPVLPLKLEPGAALDSQLRDLNGLIRGEFPTDRKSVV